MASNGDLYNYVAANVAVTFPIALEVIQDSVSGAAPRPGDGLVLGGRSVAGYSVSPSSTVTVKNLFDYDSVALYCYIDISLSVQSSYTVFNLSPLLTPIALLSSLVAFLTLLDSGSIALDLHARAAALLRRLGLLRPEAGAGGSGGGSSDDDGAPATAAAPRGGAKGAPEEGAEEQAATSSRVVFVGGGGSSGGSGGQTGASFDADDLDLGPKTSPLAQWPSAAPTEAAPLPRTVPSQQPDESAPAAGRAAGSEPPAPEPLAAAAPPAPRTFGGVGPRRTFRAAPSSRIQPS